MGCQLCTFSAIPCSNGAPRMRCQCNSSTASHLVRYYDLRPCASAHNPDCGGRHRVCNGSKTGADDVARPGFPEPCPGGGCCAVLLGRSAAVTATTAAATTTTATATAATGRDLQT